ncbi:MAG TPA: hypothetical protein VK752_30550 [Bryobacteraceae bacterium]|jgi:hypothetical protein|nr:hypothetical protein [Bryobacteraceae bacterium]
MRLVVLLIVTGVALLGDLAGVFTGALDHPAIEYSTRPVHDPVAALNAKLDRDQTLAFEPEHGYLKAVLDALAIPVESQIAVFAKNSFQQHMINPANARAIYFNDGVAVGWVRGGPLLEIASEDPEQGTIFYTLNQWKSDSPRLKRRDDCLICHESYDTLGVPGMLLRSVYPAPNGFVMRELGSYNVDHRVPFAHRWGGFFVTGKTDALSHLGNAAFQSESEAQSVETNLKGYLAPSSDIVALMVFDHQMHMTNLLTRIGWETRFAQHEKTMTPEKLAGMAKEVADYLLFSEEARISSPVEGTAGFEARFAAQGPFDKKGRSLRQFDLSRRMMRYPCSYMIYSAAFDGLPSETKDAIYRRMWSVLTGQAASRLSEADRRAILEILRETKNDLPQFFL